MKYTFIRRIDSLGRIVIPKEVRNRLKIKENENMEIEVQNESIILKKYTILNDFESNIRTFGNMLYELTNKNIIISNREKIIYTNSHIKDQFEGKELSEILIDYLINRNKIDTKKDLEIIKNISVSSNFYGLPIIFNSDVVGLIIIFDEKIREKDKITTDIINKLITFSLN